MNETPGEADTAASRLHPSRVWKTLSARLAANEAWVGRTGQLASGAERLVAWLRAKAWRSFLAGALSIGALLAASSLWVGSDRLAPLSAVVQEGPFEVRIVESGTLQALRSVTYSSSIPGNQAKIVHLIPEGSQVNISDVLVRFDAEPFSEELAQTQAQLAQAEAELVKAQEEVKLLTIAATEQVQESKDNLRLAELELENVMEGKGKLAEAESAAQMAQARRELQKAESTHEDLIPLLEEGFITKLELERARQEVDKARENLELLEIKHRTYVAYTRPAEVEGSRSSFNNSKESLRQAERAAVSRMSQTRAALKLAISKREELVSKLELQTQNLSRTEIRATVSGLVIYKEVFFGSEKRKVQIGDQVWPNQPLIMLPDLSQLTIETQVRETDIYKVAKDQPVTVSVDAYPELALSGMVSFIGTLAQENIGRPGGKYFTVTVLLDETDPRLRPGMTTRVELLVDKLENALFVPVESVFERGGRQFAYVVSGRRAEPKEVLLGPSNEHFVAIEAGLAVGQRVLLGDPSAVRDDAAASEDADFLELLGAGDDSR